MTKLPKFLALAALVAGCGDFARTGLSPADIFYFPTGMAVGHVPAGCAGGSAGCQTRLYVASSNFDLRYDLASGGALTAVDPDTAKRVGEPVRMGSFAGDVAVVDATTCPGYTADPLVLVTSRSAGALYGMKVAADGSVSCGSGCAQPLDVHLRDPFAIAVGCRGASDFTAWVSFLGSFGGRGWFQPVSLPSLEPQTAHTGTGVAVYPAQAVAYDPNTERVYAVSVYAGKQASLYYADVGDPRGARSITVPIPGEATGLAISSDGSRAYVALRLFNGYAASAGGRPVDLGGALAVLDLTEEPGGGPSGILLRLVSVGLGPSYVRAVDRRAAGMRDLVAVTCTEDSSFHLYDDEVGAVLQVIAADASGTPILGKRLYGLAVESPYRTATSASAIRYFVGSFDDGTVSTVVVDDPSRPGAVTVRPSAVVPGNP